jgi:U5 small nuclear ribonucleoprotein component
MTQFNDGAMVVDGDSGAGVIVLHEDKNYYPSAQEVYPDAEVMVQDEDTQPLETPIIAPVKVISSHLLHACSAFYLPLLCTPLLCRCSALPLSLQAKKFALIEKEMPDTTFSFRFLAGLMDHPTLARHVALLGNLHCGKSSIVDIFVQQTHMKEWDFSVQTRYTDIRVDEQERGLSVKTMPMSMVPCTAHSCLSLALLTPCAANLLPFYPLASPTSCLAHLFASLTTSFCKRLSTLHCLRLYFLLQVLPSLSGKSYLLNILDTPGHVNFCDEQTAALRLADGAVIVVDAAEGCMAQTEASIKAAVQAKLPISLVINKMDRLILELKLPPSDAYHKLCHVLQEVCARV